MSSSENQTQVYNFNLGLGPVEFTVKWGPSYEGHMGLQETAAWIETMAEKAVNDAQKWLINTIEKAKVNMLLCEPEALETFIDPMGPIFYKRAIWHAHLEVQNKVQEVVKQWEIMRSGLGSMARGGKPGARSGLPCHVPACCCRSRLARAGSGSHSGVELCRSWTGEGSSGGRKKGVV